MYALGGLYIQPDKPCFWVRRSEDPAESTSWWVNVPAQTPWILSAGLAVVVGALWVTRPAGSRAPNAGTVGGANVPAITLLGFMGLLYVLIPVAAFFLLLNLNVGGGVAGPVMAVVLVVEGIVAAVARNRRTRTRAHAAPTEITATEATRRRLGARPGNGVHDTGRSLDPGPWMGGREE
jgi:hypothetical protein